jgi:O-antigen/teichoic acid export membrane protein
MDSVSGAAPGPSVRQRFLGGAAWTTVGRAFEAGAGFFVTLVLARLLEPGDYGLLAMAMAVIGLGQQARDFGVGSALIQMPEVSKSSQEIAFTWSLLTSSAICLLLLAVSGPLALFYRDPRVEAVVRVLALAFPLHALALVPRSLLMREMNMRRVTLVQSGATAMDWIVTVVLAWRGAGVWALVAGNLASSVSAAAGFALVHPWSARPRLHGEERRSILRFGGGITSSRLLWYAYNQSDFVVVGRFLGSGPLGTYTMAWNLAKMPWDKLWASINPLMLPLFSRVRDRRDDMGRVMLRVSRYVALWSFPLLVGLAATSEDVVRVLLGAKWLGAIGPLRWLCVLGVARCLSVVLSSVLLSSGQVGREVRSSVACSILLPLGFIAVVNRGVTAVSVVWAVVFPLVIAALVLPPVLAVTRVQLRAYLAVLARPAAASGLMCAAVLAAGWVWPTPGPARLLFRVGIGAVAYAVAVRSLEKEIFSELRLLLRDIRDGARV